MFDALPADAVGLRLCRHKVDDLVLYEAVRFASGRAGVDTVLRRARISGRVEVGGDIQDHFADVLDENGNIVETVALDAGSFRALKTRWMRCRMEKDS